MRGNANTSKVTLLTFAVSLVTLITIALVASCLSHQTIGAIADTTISQEKVLAEPPKPSPDITKELFETTSYSNSIAFLYANDFTSYTYSGGCPIQQPESNEFLLSFPEEITNCQMSGSDVISLDQYQIKTLTFDAKFATPEIGSKGFDEMAVFAASNTQTYKGTEFGIRMDMNDGYICGYIQEPNGNCSQVNFKMLALQPNNGVIHHYTLIFLGSGVSFYIDGRNCGYISYPSGEDYSNLSFSILAVVHRFTNGWNAAGDQMMVENLRLQ
jgi:hypothetical protein